MTDPMTTQDNEPRTQTAPAPEPDYDDGLDHGHGWACSERGTPAH